MQGSRTFKLGSFNLLADGLSADEFLCQGGDASTSWEQRGDKLVTILSNMLLSCDAVVTQENDHFAYILQQLQERFETGAGAGTGTETGAGSGPGIGIGGVFGVNTALSSARSRRLHRLYLTVTGGDTSQASVKDPLHEEHYIYINKHLFLNQRGGAHIGAGANTSTNTGTGAGAGTGAGTGADGGAGMGTGSNTDPPTPTHTTTHTPADSSTHSYLQESARYGALFASLYGAQARDLYRCDDGIGVYYRTDRLRLVDVCAPGGGGGGMEVGGGGGMGAPTIPVLGVEGDSASGMGGLGGMGMGDMGGVEGMGGTEGQPLTLPLPLPQPPLMLTQGALTVVTGLASFVRCSFELVGSAGTGAGVAGAGAGTADTGAHTGTHTDTGTHTGTPVLVTLYGGHLKSGEGLPQETQRHAQLLLALQDASTQPTPILAMDSNNSLLYEENYPKDCRLSGLIREWGFVDAVAVQEGHSGGSGIDGGSGGSGDSGIGGTGIDTGTGSGNGSISGITSNSSTHSMGKGMGMGMGGNECLKMRHGQGGQTSKHFQLMFDTIDKILIPKGLTLAPTPAATAAAAAALAVALSPAPAPATVPAPAPAPYDQCEFGFQRYPPQDRDFLLILRRSAPLRAQLQAYCRERVTTTCALEAFGDSGGSGGSGDRGDSGDRGNKGNSVEGVGGMGGDSFPYLPLVGLYPNPLAPSDHPPVACTVLL